MAAMSAQKRFDKRKTGCWRHSGLFCFSLLFFIGIVLAAFSPAFGDLAGSDGPLHLAGFAFLGLGQLFGQRAEAESAPVAPAVPGDMLLPARRVSPQADRQAPVASDEPPAETDETQRLLGHVLATPAGAIARRVLITHLPTPEAPLGVLECAAFASHFARALACEGRTILVMLGSLAVQRPGLFELVEGTASFSEAIHREAGSRLHVLPAGRGRAAAGAARDMVIDALSETYDFVVLVTADEDGEVARRQVLGLAARADHVLIACTGQVGSPDMLTLHDAVRDEGAGDVVAARIGLNGFDARAAA
jgi:hypothetical protein